MGMGRRRRRQLSEAVYIPTSSPEFNFASNLSNRSASQCSIDRTIPSTDVPHIALTIPNRTITAWRAASPYQMSEGWLA